MAYHKSNMTWLRFECMTYGDIGYSFSEQVLILLPRLIPIPEGKLNWG